MKYLVAAALLCGAVQVAYSHELLVGSPNKTAKSIEKAVEGLGQIGTREDTGFYRLTLKDGIELKAARALLAKRGILYVFDADVLHIDTNSLPSVEKFIECKQASAKLLGITGEEVGVDFYEALEYYLKFRVDATGRLPREAYAKAAEHRNNMPPAMMRKPKATGGVTQRIAVGATWSYVGPLALDVPYRQYYGVPTISGRKNDVQYAQSNPNTMYTASAGGGVWKSTNAGTTWTPKSDGWQFLHTSTVAVSPTDENLVLAGTGDYTGFFSAQTFGIMRSVDGGNTWTNVGAALMADKIVSKIVFDPTNANTVIATAGRGVTPGDIYRSTDGGITWASTNALDGSWDNVDFAGVDIAPGVRRAWACGGGTASGTKIAYSDDHGSTWTQIANPAGFVSVEQNLCVAGSENDPDGVYVIGPINHKIYKSANGGAAWTDITAGFNGDWSQSDYDNYIVCGKSGATDIIYVGLISVHASSNGGSTWADIAITASTNSKWHNDQHCLTLHPTIANESYIGGDGGLARMVYNPATNSATITPKNDTFADEQFYAIALHPTNANIVMGGTQDNSTPASRGNLSAWDNLYAGDGGFCGFNKASPGTHYTTAQLGSVYKYDTELDATPTSITPTGANVFVTPLAMGNTTFNEPFTVSGNKLRRYSGNRWVASKTTLATNADRVDVAKRNGQRIFTSHANGNIYMSKDNGTNLARIDGNLPDQAVGAVCESPFTDYDVIAVLKTTAAGVGRAYRCTNVNVANPVWFDISGSGLTALPSMPGNAVVRDPFDANTFYVGMDIGAFMTTDGGSTWTNMNALGLPNTHVNDLVINNSNSHLYVGTSGRGIWRIALSP